MGCIPTKSQLQKSTKIFASEGTPNSQSLGNIELKELKTLKFNAGKAIVTVNIYEEPPQEPILSTNSVPVY